MYTIHKTSVGRDSKHKKRNQGWPSVARKVPVSFLTAPFCAGGPGALYAMDRADLEEDEMPWQYNATRIRPTSQVNLIVLAHGYMRACLLDRSACLFPSCLRISRPAWLAYYMLRPSVNWYTGACHPGLEMECSSCSALCAGSILPRVTCLPQKNVAGTVTNRSRVVIASPDAALNSIS